MIAEGISILERMIDPDHGDFTPEVAKYFLAFDFSAEQHARYELLSGKAAAGNLSDTEASELDELIAANAILSVLQSKARLSTRQQTPAA